MWFVYRFYRDTNLAQTQQRDLIADIAEFSNCVIRSGSQTGRWVPASAKATDGGREIWYNLPHLPDKGALGQAWARYLGEFALTCRRSTNRT